jgi:hypothetical protein
MLVDVLMFTCANMYFFALLLIYNPNYFVHGTFCFILSIPVVPSQRYWICKGQHGLLNRFT